MPVPARDRSVLFDRVAQRPLPPTGRCSARSAAAACNAGRIRAPRLPLERQALNLP